MDRICFCYLFFSVAPLIADEPRLPDTVPPFALGDLCVASVVEENGIATIYIEMFGLRSRRVEISDDIPVELEGKKMYPDAQVRDTFSPTRHHSIGSSPLHDLSVWDTEATKLQLTTVKKRLAKKTRVVLVSRDITDNDVEYLRYFGEDVLFIRLSKLMESVLKKQR